MNQRGGAYDINATGYLTIAGATNRIDLYVLGKVGSRRQHQFRWFKKIENDRL
jgi:hypothetical protein